VDGGATGEAFVVAGMHGGEDLLFLSLHRAEMVGTVEDLNPTEATQCDAVTGLTEAETGLVDCIHEIGLVHNVDFTARRFASHDGGRHLELAQIHSFLPWAERRPNDVEGL